MNKGYTSPFGKTHKEFSEEIQLSKPKKIDLDAEKDINNILSVMADEVEKGEYFGNRGKDTLVLLDKKRTLLKKDIDIVQKQIAKAEKAFDKLENTLQKVGAEIKKLGMKPQDAPYFNNAVKRSNKLFANYTQLEKTLTILKKNS